MGLPLGLEAKYMKASEDCIVSSQKEEKEQPASRTGLISFHLKRFSRTPVLPRL